MFTPEEREQLVEDLVSAARADARITGAAVTGSAALGREDRWSDVDLALSVAADPEQVLAEWTDRMYREHAAVDHLEVVFGATVFRVFLLASTLQVDIAFWPKEDFGATGPTFRLLFGEANERPPTPEPAAAHLIGMAWLYALHARSCIARGEVWRAEYMVSGIRDHVLALACVRHGLPATQGRGMDRLPPEVSAPIAGALVRSLDVSELRRAFGVITGVLLAEAAEFDADLAGRLAGPLQEMAGR